MYEFVGLTLADIIGIAQVADISATKYRLEFLKGGYSETYHKDFIDKNCISLGMELKTIEILYLQ